jgi:PiT family inorganic phosphate transporter
MVAAWVLTLPAAGLVAAGAALLADQGGLGVTAVAVLGLAACGAMWAAARRKPVTAENVNDPSLDGDLAPAEPQGAVTAAIAAVTPPPAGPAAATAPPSGPAAPGPASAGPSSVAPAAPAA